MIPKYCWHRETIMDKYLSLNFCLDGQDPRELQYILSVNHLWYRETCNFCQADKWTNKMLLKYIIRVSFMGMQSCGWTHAWFKDLLSLFWNYPQYFQFVWSSTQKLYFWIFKVTSNGEMKSYELGEERSGRNIKIFFALGWPFLTVSWFKEYLLCTEIKAEFKNKNFTAFWVKCFKIIYKPDYGFREKAYYGNLILGFFLRKIAWKEM